MTACDASPSSANVRIARNLRLYYHGTFQASVSSSDTQVRAEMLKGERVITPHDQMKPQGCLTSLLWKVSKVTSQRTLEVHV